MLERLGTRDMPVGELAEPFDLSPPAISKHLRVLERAGLIEQNRRGRFRHCRLRPAPLRTAAEWIDHYRVFWTDQLGALAECVESADSDRSGADARRQPRKPRKPGATS